MKKVLCLLVILGILGSNLLAESVFETAKKNNLVERIIKENNIKSQEEFNQCMKKQCQQTIVNSAKELFEKYDTDFLNEIAKGIGNVYFIRCHSLLKFFLLYLNP